MQNLISISVSTSVSIWYRGLKETGKQRLIASSGKSLFDDSNWPPGLSYAADSPIVVPRFAHESA